MLKTLIKKQLLEINKGFFYNQKAGTMRSKASSIAFIVGYFVLIFGLLGYTFGMIAYGMSALTAVGLDWLYFALLSLIAVALGIFGSVFNTYSGLYLAKDNDLLLSMPIPVTYILISRMLGVYLMGLLFSSMVMLPAVVVYMIVKGFNYLYLIGGIAMIIIISAIVFVLACVLGYFVAVISKKTKNKSFITVAISLLFIAVYYFCYFKANDFVSNILSNAEVIGGKIKGKAYPVYFIGRAGEGNLISVAVCLLVVAALVALTVYIISRSFISIATSSGTVAKGSKKSGVIKVKSVNSTLFSKEVGRFVSSSNYMLNCALGVLFIPAFAVAILFKGDQIKDMLVGNNLINAGEFVVALIMLICTLSSMIDTAAPSVSLEGKNIWIVQSLPIDFRKVLNAKLKLQLSLAVLPVAFCCVVAIAVFKFSLVYSLFIAIVPLLYTVLTALFDLFLNLKFPNLAWTNEIVPIKQSMSVTIALLGGWAFAFAIAGLYFWLNKYICAEIYLSIVTALLIALIISLYCWLQKRGAEIFASL